MSKLAHSNDRTKMSHDLIAAREALGAQEAWNLFMETLDDYERPQKEEAQRKFRHKQRVALIADRVLYFVCGLAVGLFALS